MTGAQTLAAFRRALVPAVAVGLVTMALVVGVLLSRSPSYQARLSLYAKPATSSSTTAGNYGEIVSTNMPALSELAASDGTLQAIKAAVPGAPDADVLRGQITVELVPASGVARITVVGASAQTATDVLKALLVQIDKADLLAPVAALRPTGSQELRAELVERDPSLALGLGIIAALVASLSTVVLVQTLRPRLLTPQDVEKVVHDVFEDGDDAPPVVDLRDPSSGLNLLAAHLLSQNPLVNEVTVVPTGPVWRGDLARQLRNALRNLRVAREVGVAGSAFSSAPAASGNGARNGATGELSGPAMPAPVRRGALFSDPISSSTRTAARPGAAQQTTPGGSPLSDGGPSHLVVTVRLARTTPVALQTALIALRTHGTGVAGVAVG